MVVDMDGRIMPRPGLLVRGSPLGWTDGGGRGMPASRLEWNCPKKQLDEVNIATQRATDVTLRRPPPAQTWWLLT